MKVDEDEHAVFLSGNGPLVDVLREALTRDEVLTAKENGEKLSKQNGALALDLQHPVQALNTAAHVLGLPRLPEHTPVNQALIHWTTLHTKTLGAPFAKKA